MNALILGIRLTGQTTPPRPDLFAMAAPEQVLADPMFVGMDAGSVRLDSNPGRPATQGKPAATQAISTATDPGSAAGSDPARSRSRSPDRQGSTRSRGRWDANRANRPSSDPGAHRRGTGPRSA